MIETKRLVGLDLLRALAILLVLYCHGMTLFYPFANEFLGNTTFSLFGYIGVDVFFVLSGYLIGTIFLRDYLIRENDTLTDTLNFWKRRWARTLPNYYLMLGIYVALEWSTSNLSLNQVLSFVIFSQNLFTKNGTFFLQAWSLSVEEWFYLLFPIFVYVTNRLIGNNRKLSPLITCFWILLAGNLCRYLFFLAGTFDVKSMTQMIVFKFDSIVYGVVMAYLYFYWQAKIDVRKNILFTMGFLVILLACAMYIFFILIASPREGFGLLTMFLIPLGAMLILPFFKNLSWNPDTILARLVRQISLVSYSAYLNHFIILHGVIIYIRPSNLTEGLGAFGLFLFLVFCVSSLQYAYFEKYFLSLRDRNLKQR